jgi:hypothetical protein
MASDDVDGGSTCCRRPAHGVDKVGRRFFQSFDPGRVDDDHDGVKAVAGTAKTAMADDSRASGKLNLMVNGGIHTTMSNSVAMLQ